ncbi:MAG: DUF3500 domain-containing protein [Planctomycetaceae bacterium]|nr:DUF3500 domain-containing protein [Planctomycetaceae bacterium]
MLRRWIPVSLVLIVALIAGGAMRLLLEDPGKTMTDAAAKFIGTLNAEAKHTAMLKYDDPTRLKWHFIPMPERKGLQVKNMTADQRAAALELLRSALSQVGYHKATEIMSLEGILRELEKDRKGGPIRDPDRYYYTLFGTPGAQGTWGLSVEGHHLSLNFVVRDGKVLAHTPAFFGANPATCRNEIAGYPKPGTRTLAKEEQLAFDLLGSLSSEQRQTVIRAEKAPADIRGPADSQPPQSAPEGIAISKLNDAQQKTVKSLVTAYADNMPESVAAKRLAEINEAGWDKVYFSWAGADKPGVGHYYRVQGPTFLIEFVNVQPDAAGNPANHIHSVWRDLRGDFGVSL